MSVELHTDEGAARPLPSLSAVPDLAPDRDRPNVSGDLPTMFQAAPMFRRSVGGYDRFQVDTYVQWAEDELATAEREREHLIARCLSTRAALDEARLLLSHSRAGGDFLQASESIGSLLAAAADEAEALRAAAAADRAAATVDAARTIADAERLLADTEIEAQQVAAEAATRAAELTAEAGRILDRAELDADEVGNAARTAAAALVEAAGRIERRALDAADELRSRALDEAATARLRARDEVVAMLNTAREERRRADESAAAAREALDRAAAVRLTALLAEVDLLEERRAALRAEIARGTRPVVDPAEGHFGIRLRRSIGQLRSRSVRTP